MIARFWYWLVGSFCKHQWEIFKEINMYKQMFEGSTEYTPMPIRTDYILKCAHCGKLEKFSGG